MRSADSRPAPALNQKPMLIGLISDTHGLLRPEAVRALAGVDLIVHAGDVGGAGVLEGLRAVAPVDAVYGNVDDPHDPALARERTVPIGALTLHVSHGHEVGSPTPERLALRYTADVLVFGHTHRPLVVAIGRQLVINPGAAGPRRFNLEPSVARLRVTGSETAVELIALAG